MPQKLNTSLGPFSCALSRPAQSGLTAVAPKPCSGRRGLPPAGLAHDPLSTRSVYGDAPEIGDRSTTWFSHVEGGCFKMFSGCAHQSSGHFLQLGCGELADFALLSRVHVQFL